jgi:4-hydroxy-tetrahydrodipicolinate synthase
MAESIFRGVIPAVTTPFSDDLQIDHAFLGKHVAWLVESGASGIVPLGSLGEGATLGYDEKLQVLKTCIAACAGRAPVAPGIAALATADAVRLARDAEAAGCGGLMALPAYVHNGAWHETRAHFEAVIGATQLPCMLYNNPIAYGTDVTPEQVAALAEAHPNLVAVKESSGDIRRITAIRALVGDRLDLLVGLDDLLVEGVAAGAGGWIAGLVNALPRESVRLFELASAGERDRAAELYRWFLPLLRMATVPEFVQLIKLVQAEVGMGSETVRPPRLRLPEAEREAALAIARRALASRPAL